MINKPLSLNQIAKFLKKEAHKYPERSEERVTIKIDGLTIRCAANCPAILAVAEKYRKGKAHKVIRAQKNDLANRFSAPTLRAFLADNEPLNAYYYALQYPGKVPLDLMRQINTHAKVIQEAIYD